MLILPTQSIYNKINYSKFKKLERRPQIIITNATLH